MKNKYTISLYDLIFKFDYKKFTKKQIYFSLHPIEHFKELFK